MDSLKFELRVKPNNRIDTLATLDLRKAEERVMAYASIGFSARDEDMVKNPDGSTTITKCNLESFAAHGLTMDSMVTYEPFDIEAVRQMQMRGRAIRMKERTKAKALSFGIFYYPGARSLVRRMKRDHAFRHVFKMKALTRIRRMAQAGKLPKPRWQNATLTALAR
jgi:hypothetical protein